MIERWVTFLVSFRDMEYVITCEEGVDDPLEPIYSRYPDMEIEDIEAEAVLKVLSSRDREV